MSWKKCTYIYEMLQFRRLKGDTLQTFPSRDKGRTIISNKQNLENKAF